MTFPAVLSALRGLILDRAELPSSYEERLVEYRRAFPALNTDEIEDLAKINPAGFKIYATSTFVGQRTLIRRYLEVTSAAIEAFYQKQDENFRFLELMQKMHLNRPWRSTSCNDLLRNFIAFVTEDLGELLAGVPGLKELAEFEFMEYLAIDTHITLDMHVAISLADIEKLQVSELLQAKFAIPANTSIANFEYNVSEYCKSFYANDKTLPSEPLKKSPNWRAFGCGLDFKPVNIEIDAWLSGYLVGLSKDTWYGLDNLAERFIENAATGQSEEQIFNKFMLKTVEAIKAGVLVLRRPYIGI